MALLSLVGRKKIGEIISSSKETHAGLRLVIVEVSHVDDELNNNTIVVKSGLKSLTRTPISSFYRSSCCFSSSVISSNNNGDFDCFLKSCHLCKKPLSPDKDVYMYRGDQGFCSTQCRSRQIRLDEMQEMDEMMKIRKLKNDAPSSPIDCVGCESCRLLEDLRKRRFQRNANKFKPNHTLISPVKPQQPLLSIS